MKLHISSNSTIQIEVILIVNNIKSQGEFSIQMVRIIFNFLQILKKFKIAKFNIMSIHVDTLLFIINFYR